MIARQYSRRFFGGWFIPAAVVLSMLADWAHTSRAAERKFFVMPAYSPKEQPNPTLVNFAVINQAYFDNNPTNNVFSFAEYWREVSYGDVTVTGQTSGWVLLPWRYHAPMDNTPEDLVDNDTGDTQGINRVDFGGIGLSRYAYGAAEDVVAGQVMITFDWNGNLPGNGGPPPPPLNNAGATPPNAPESGVYTPGERFVDLNSNAKFDALNEVIAVDWRYGIDYYPNDGVTPPTDLEWNATDWNQDGMLSNISQDCLLPKTFPVPPTENACMCECIPTGGMDNPMMPNCACGCPAGSTNGLADCENCEALGPGQMDCPNRPNCCEFADKDNDQSLDFPDPFEDFLVKYASSPTDAGAAVPAMFPDQWVMVDNDYVTNNYPGNRPGVIARSGDTSAAPIPPTDNPNGPVTGNGYYDPPDRWRERGNTKMIQQFGGLSFITATPDPGHYPYGNQEGIYESYTWFDDFWQVWYGGTTPTWPPWTQGPPFPGASDAKPNTPRMAPFVPYMEGDMSTWRLFNPNRGGLTGWGFGENGGTLGVERTYSNWDFAAGTYQDPGGRIYPDYLGFYDGWVEHDDLASSKYHNPFRRQDQRLGEVTSPFLSNIGGMMVDTIWGQDRGLHDPSIALVQPDQFTVAAGPFAINTHGSQGFDAGNVLLLEMMTWRTDGTSPTGASLVFQDPMDPAHHFSFWDTNYGPWHPYQGGNNVMNLPNGWGFRDYTLDGIVDQGEVRPPGSENYVKDGDTGTIDNGGPSTFYPWNRQRIVEDIIAALDFSVDFDPYNDANSLHAVGIPSDPDVGPTGLLSGVVLLPAGAQQAGTREWSLPAPSFLPVHNEDQLEPGEIYNWRIWVHDIAAGLDNAGEGPADLGVGTFQTAFAAHEYMHTWEGQPDLYDYDVYNPTPLPINAPIGRWCVMAGGGLVHPFAPLKAAAPGAGPNMYGYIAHNWSQPVNLETVLVPGAPRTIILSPSEFFRQNSYYYYENARLLELFDRHERFYFWSVGQGFDQFMPGGDTPQGVGALIGHTDLVANPNGLPPQQVLENHFTYYMVQADGLYQMGDNPLPPFGTGNSGDTGDPFPGRSTDPGNNNPNTTFSFNTNPASEWWDLLPTGLRVDNIQYFPNNGSASMRFTWTPPDVPSLSFNVPPGGQSVNGIYNVNYDVTDLHAGTNIRFYFASQFGNYTMVNSGVGANLIGCKTKPVPGTVAGETVGWRLNAGMPPNPCNGQAAVAAVPNGNYYIFAKLIPGPGVDGGTEAWVSPVRPGVNNVGNGTVNIAIPSNAMNQVTKSESWSLRALTGGANATWRVTGSVSGQQMGGMNIGTGIAMTGVAYTSDKINFQGQPDPNGFSAVGFTITNGSAPFAANDEFVFVTTGLTVQSSPVQVIEGQITNGPIAHITYDTVTGTAPLTVHFSALTSTDPNGLPLTFTWNFGDGQAGGGVMVTHTFQLPGNYTVTLTATNPSGQFGQATQPVVAQNNPPMAHIVATPRNGPAPLVVNFDGTTSTDPDNLPLAYAWNFGDGAQSPLASPMHVYNPVNAPQCFTATLTVTDMSGATNSAAMQIVAGNTEPHAAQPTTTSMTFGAPPLMVTFHDGGSFDPDNQPAGAAPLIFTWNFGDGSAPMTGTGLIQVTHNYTALGPHMTSVTVADPTAINPSGSCPAPGMLSVTVPGPTIIVSSGTTPPGGGNPPPANVPVARFTATPTSGAAPLDVAFDASGSTIPTGTTPTYTWNFGDGDTGTGVMTPHTFDAAGSFAVVLTVRAGANSDTDTQTIVVGSGAPAVPVASASATPNSGTVPLLVSFSSAGSSPADASFTWTFGDGSGTAGATVTHTYNQVGTYTATLRVTNTAGMIATATVDVSVNAPPAENQPPVAVIATGLRTGVAPVRLTFEGNLSNDPDGDLADLSFHWEVLRADGTLLQMSDGVARVSFLFDTEGTYTLTLTVMDAQGASNTSAPETIDIRSRSSGGDNTNENGEMPESPSGGRRTTPRMCGFGFISLAGLALGLAALSAGRRRP